MSNPIIFLPEFEPEFDETEIMPSSSNEDLYGNRTQRLEGGESVNDSSESMSIDDMRGLETAEDRQKRKLRRRRARKCLRWFKIFLMICWWSSYTLILIFKHEHKPVSYLRCVPPTGKFLTVKIQEDIKTQTVLLRVHGPFVPFNFSTSFVEVTVEKQTFNNAGIVISTQTISDSWRLYLENADPFDIILFNRFKQFFSLNEKVDLSGKGDYEIVFQFKSNTPKPVPIEIVYYTTPIPSSTGTIMGVLLLFTLLLLIMFRLVNFTLAAVFTCTMSIAMVAIWHLRPTLGVILSWIEADHLMLIFSMTLIVTICTDSGIMDFLIVWTYQLSNGHIWPMLNCMLLTVLIGAAFLDTLTILLLIIPLQIKLCEVLELNPAPVHMCLIIAANLGKALLPINVTITETITGLDVYLMSRIGVSTYFKHMFPGLLLVIAASYLHLRLLFFDSSMMQFSESPQSHRMRRVIRHWKHRAQTMSGYSKDEKMIRDTVMSKARHLHHRIRRLGRMPLPSPKYDQVLRQLKSTYQVQYWPQFSKCVIALCMLVFLLALNGIPTLSFTLPKGWITFLAALFLLILSDIDNLEGMLNRIDWSTMLFLTTLHILIHVLGLLGLFDSISRGTKYVIRSSSPKSRLTVGILMILWVSGITSSVLYDVPVTSGRSLIMRIVYTLSDKEDLSLPLEPLVWAMYLGVIIGSNGTIIGAIANIVVAGAVEKHGYDFSFWYFFKVAFPIMIQNLIIATLYLLFCHVLFNWH